MSLGHYHATVLYNGLILPGVSVLVTVTGSSTHAVLFSDAAGTVSLANPFMNDPTFGTIDFFVAAGTYDLVATKIGFFEFVALDHGAHGAIKKDNPLFQQLSQE